MLEKAILEKKSIRYIAAARSLFGHWIEQRKRSIQRLEVVNRDGVRHHHCPVLVISCEAEQLHTSALEFGQSTTSTSVSGLLDRERLLASQITRGTRLDIKCVDTQTQLLLRC